MHLATPLRDLPFLPAARVRQMERAGVATVEDLLLHFPRRYEDRREFDRFPQEESEQAVCVCGLVTKAAGKRLRGHLKLFEITLEDEQPTAFSGRLVCRWFNQYWIEKVLAVGHRVVVYGKPKRRGPQIILDHPEFELLEEETEKVSLHLRRLVPIHKVTEGHSPRLWRRYVWELLQQLTPREIPDLLPPELDPQPRLAALREIHFPETFESLERARRHLVLTEFFGLQLALGQQRTRQAALPGRTHAPPGELVRRLLAALPYALTGAQERALREIRQDMASPHPMSRLLHGDVGAGKTLVALCAMLTAVETGAQAALMAPTQILAEQHYLNFRHLLEPLGLNLALRTGSRKEDTTLPLFDAQGGRVEGRTGRPRIIVGTHALLYEGAGLHDLGLAVIDEQHKFGVEQRARLRGQGSNGRIPDLLVMTATPIPRTMAMTVFGDLDVSVLDELPKNRGKIITGVRPEAKRPEAARFLREHLEAGRQAYLVCPLVEESEKLEAKAATAEHRRWSELLAPLRCELLHGRLPPEEKEAVMERFRRGETAALVATTVIEVGIDVPNANLMLIENAERFGLAQLHQLRGRIGRGVHKSYCILLTDEQDPATLEKLRLLEQTTNGFEIAEADLHWRGPGDVLGTAQAGLPPLRIGHVLGDPDLMRTARTAAFLLLERDPDLSEPENRRYRLLLHRGGAVSQD